MSTDPHTLRLLLAAALVLAYLGMCAAIWRGQRRKARASQAQARALALAPQGAQPLLLAWASQTGQAEALARHTAELLHTAGEAVHLLPLGSVTAQTLAQATRALFIVSTYGEGDAPDMAAPFVNGPMTGTPALPQLEYAVLALGDASYAHFCGFGRTLDAWLAATGARTLFERIDADQASARACADALAHWQRQLGHVARIEHLPAWQEPTWQRWALARRVHLNPGSAGQPVYHLELAPAGDSASTGPVALPEWQAGDLVQIRPPADPDHPRDYSIASLPSDGRVHLLVRRQQRADGTPGMASGWLTSTLAEGEPVDLRLRAHTAFRLGDNATRPLILIGNGTGLAGLRSHLKARAAAGQGENWLIFGERQAAHDWLYRDDIARWQAAGLLARVDTAFSRDGPRKRYVQDVLAAEAGQLRQWLARGAAIYVCGSLQGMATGVDTALRHAVGHETVDALIAQGRYRRDVY
ncbi:MAG: sulfite reductase subunit alpha [Comamonadaceae bacterium]|nr:sulfite reductase subunit alpha [Comamonadaceae bacterium]